MEPGSSTKNQEYNLQPKLSKGQTSTNQREALIMDSYSALAKNYDIFTKIANLGQNIRIRKKLVERTAPRPGAKHIDMSTGTGEVARLIFEYHEKVNKDNTATVHAVDLNKEMLNIARNKFKDSVPVQEGRFTFEIANAENLDTIPDNTYDIYTISAGLYNMNNPDKAIREAYRVLKPGGTFACIEFIKPTRSRVPFLGLLFEMFLYLFFLLFGVSDKILRLGSALQEFKPAQALVNDVRDAGFVVFGKGYETVVLGAATITIGIKPGAHC